MRLNGKTAIVTGGAQGIGRAIARKFAGEGARVIIGDVNREVGLATALATEKMTGRVVYFHELNVTSLASVMAFTGNALTLFGERIDILVNNAGIMRDATLLNMRMKDFDAVINVNLRGVFLITREVARHMAAQGGGVILNASAAVARGNFGQTPYAASKAGVEAMTVTWARELATYGVRVNAVAPGLTETPMTCQLPQKAKDRVLARTPLGKFATPEEIADTYVFLASDEAKFITGQVVRVDGGFIN